MRLSAPYCDAGTAPSVGAGDGNGREDWHESTHRTPIRSRRRIQSSTMASLSDHPDPTGGSAPGRAPASPGVKTAEPALVGLAVALAAGAAILGLGRFVEDPAAAAEAGYLATLTVLLLGCVAVLGYRGGNSPTKPTTLLPWSALAAVTAAWVLPPGPGRGAAVLALLVASVAMAATGVRLTPAILPRHGSGPHEGGTGTVAATLRATGVLLPLAVAVQVIFRGGDLLHPALDAHTLVVFLAMPLAVALKVAFLAVRRGAVPAGIAAATVILWTGGLNVAATVAFLGLAAGEALRDPGLARRGLLVRACAVAALAAPFAWQPRTAAVAAAAGLLMTGGVAAGAAVAVAAVAAALLAPLQSWPEVTALLGLGLLLLPLVPWLAARRAGWGAGWGINHALTVVGGLALAVAAARSAPALVGTSGGDVAVPALAAPLALLALVATAGATATGRPGGPGLALQRLWSGGLLLAAGLASAYPWLRPDAARSVLEAVGLHPDGVAPVATALVATFAAAALVGVTHYLAGRTAADEPSESRRSPDTANGDSRIPADATGWALLASALVVLLLLTAGATPAPPFGRTLVGHPGVLLSAEAPRVEAALAPAGEAPGDEPREIHRLALVGSLVRAEGVADGATVATVTVLAGDRPLATWPLRAGEDLGEWAARRPEVAAALMHRPPEPWASWVAPGGDYLGQIYRARHDARDGANTQAEPDRTADPSANSQAAPGSPLRLVLERDPGLPPSVQVHVRRLEAWP